MTSPISRAARWLRAAGLISGLAITPAALAQGGFGPDPYRPYNSQYDSFVYPIAPGSGDVVPSEAAMSRAGMSRSNQYQEYLRGTGIGSGGSTFRSQRQLDPESFRESQYQPNRKVDEESGFNKKQDFVSQAYFAYLRERDPKKRAELLKKYQAARSKPMRDFAESKSRRTDRGSAADPRSGLTASSRSSKPAAPPVRGGLRPSAPGTPGVSGSTGTQAANPSDVLEEGLKRERELKASRPGRVGLPPPPRDRSPSTVPPAPPH